jgi:hypothetical protein
MQSFLFATYGCWQAASGIWALEFKQDLLDFKEKIHQIDSNLRQSDDYMDYSMKITLENLSSIRPNTRSRNNGASGQLPIRPTCKVRQHQMLRIHGMRNVSIETERHVRQYNAQLLVKATGG